MKKQAVIFHANGENSGTYGPLFKGSTKNEFKLSLRAQVTSWLNNEVSFANPLSQNQYNAASKYVNFYDLQHIDSSLYNNRYL